MRDRVLDELRRIEAQEGVRVLLAVESGSRAWGFASPDSDYDVRFIYAHEPDWYLSVFENRDVIEEMLPGKLDLSGWDLRKTLRLFSKCNLALNEWLGSPIVYCEVGGFRNRFAELIPRYFNPIGALHHYRSMADRALTEHLEDGSIGIKKLFYVLRPLLACRWIEQTSAQPPTEFQQLITPAWVTADERNWIADLLRQKSGVMEAQSIRLEETRAASIRSELDRYQTNASVSAPVPREGKWAELNTFFRDLIVMR